MEEQRRPKRPRTEANAKAEAKYKAENVRFYSVGLNRKTDADIIDFLDQRQELGYSIQGAIKDCLRYAINQNHVEYTPRHSD